MPIGQYMADYGVAATALRDGSDLLSWPHGAERRLVS